MTKQLVEITDATPVTLVITNAMHPEYADFRETHTVEVKKRGRHWQGYTMANAEALEFIEMIRVKAAGHAAGGEIKRGAPIATARYARMYAAALKNLTWQLEGEYVKIQKREEKRLAREAARAAALKAKEAEAKALEATTSIEEAAEEAAPEKPARKTRNSK